MQYRDIEFVGFEYFLHGLVDRGIEMHIEIEPCDLFLSYVGDGYRCIDLPALVCRIGQVEKEAALVIVQHDLLCLDGRKALFIIYLRIFKQCISLQRTRVEPEVGAVHIDRPCQSVESVGLCHYFFSDPPVEFLRQ